MMDAAQAFDLEEIARYSIVNETIARGDSAVQRFYEGAVIFITGGSGFLGKQLIEKLFRSCRIKKIYILMRPKKEKYIEDRKNEILKDQLYEYLHKTQPDFVSKLIPVEGDITEFRVGLSEKDWNTLTEEVDIIFHGAATINFTEPLKVAILTNLRGAKEMLALGKSCKRLKSYVHISTAFAHATPERTQQDVLEQFYECPFTPNFILDLAQEFDESKLDAITPQLIGSWPNTYTFTKALAEELVRTTAEDLPICIVRPAIVIAAYREPPGWVDKTCLKGPVGFMTGAALGGLHVMFVHLKKIFDIVPVDLTNNAALVAAYATTERRKRGETDIKIYTVTSRRNAINFETLNKYFEDARQYAPAYMLWYPYMILTESKFIFSLLFWLLHLIPGYLVDLVLSLIGQKPKTIK